MLAELGVESPQKLSKNKKKAITSFISTLYHEFDMEKLLEFLSLLIKKSDDFLSKRLNYQEKGGRQNLLLETYIKHLLFIYRVGTGKNTTLNWNNYKGIRYSECLDFVMECFEHAKIQATKSYITEQIKKHRKKSNFGLAFELFATRDLSLP